MQLFEHPQVTIMVFVLFFVALVAIGISFAVRGTRTAKDEVEVEFENIKKLEKHFCRGETPWENRCLIYGNISLDSYRSLHSDKLAAKVLFELKDVLLRYFYNAGQGMVCIYGENNPVILTSWKQKEVRENMEKLQCELNRYLTNFEALHQVDIRFGVYFAAGQQIPLNVGINRAKQACILAQNENIAYAEWSINNGKNLEQKLKIASNIESEIDNNRFFLEYQPVLDVQTREIIGAEVLARLNSDNGILFPGSFLSAVDSAGVNGKFDYYIFEKNCKWISNNRKQREGYTYTVNFSRATLSEPSFAQNIIEIAEKYGLSFSCLAVEILEDKKLSEEAKKQMTQNLLTLKEKGLSILLDDFGSGYTTFGDLQNLDVSIVKIDRAITQNAVTETGYIILKNIIQTAKDIGFKTLCEGVETQEQEEAAIRAGCDMLQGFYYYKPIPVSQLEKIFARKNIQGLSTVN